MKTWLNKESLNHCEGDYYLIIGSPVKHSLSPKMHNLAFKLNNIPATYFSLDLKVDELPEVIKNLKNDKNFKGMNITYPLKEAVLKYCDELSEVSKLTGAVNTVKNEDGRWIATTTDGIGFFNGLNDNNVEVKGKKILLLGAGGAARVIAAQSLFEGIDELIIFNRTLQKAQNLKEKLQETADKTGVKIRVFPLEDEDRLSKEVEESDILVNATSVGMGSDDNSLIKPEDLHENLVVCEIVYKEKTELAKEAEKQGLKVIDGLPMLLFQGAESFKIWTDKEFPVAEVQQKLFDN